MGLETKEKCSVQLSGEQMSSGGDVLDPLKSAAL